jgi:hypothetical protein
MSYPSSLHQIRDHDDDVDVVFPNHSPESVKGRREGTLGPNIRPRLPKPVNEMRVVKCEDVQVAILLLIFWMLGMLSRILVLDRDSLECLVLLGEANVPVGM